MTTPTKTSAKKAAAVKKPAPSHPSFYSMTVEAITQSTDRKGATVPAIRNYITETHKAVDPAALKFRLKQALTKAVDQAVVEKVKSSEDRPLMSSRFRLNKAKAAADEKEKKKKEKAKEKKAADAEKTKTKVAKKTTKKADGASPKKLPKAKKPKAVAAKSPVKKAAAKKPKVKATTKKAPAKTPTKPAARKAIKTPMKQTKKSSSKKT